MYARLRALERKLIHELYELAVEEHANDLADEWQEAVENDREPPGALDFVQGLIREGFYLPKMSRAIEYLTGCYYGKTLPDPERLAQILLPWYTSTVPAWP